MTFDEYMRGLRGKKTAILGLGVSNIPLLRLLAKYGADITVHDKKTAEKLGPVYEKAASLGTSFHLGDGYLDRVEADVVFRSPGIRPDLPALQKVLERGGEITSEMEAFFKVCPCRIIGVTGSDGKTTTTTLIYEILKKAGYRCHVGGNIGRPLLADVPDMTREDIAVLELSSFQLMTLKMSPDVSVITNISPNHLDMHKSMDEYIDAKKNIYKWQSPTGRLVLNADNAVTAGLKNEAKGEVLMFSRKEEPEEGAFMRDGTIYVREKGKEERVLEISDILVPGMHNVENYMAAILSVRGLAGKEAVRSTAVSFPGVAHRIEFVRELDGVKFYNSSIDSSPTRTAAALASFRQKCIVICGGYDKKVPFEPLGDTLVERAKTVVLIGATAEKIRTAVVNAPGYKEGAPHILMADSLEKAVNVAREQARSGDVVILSPACASFDMFENFEKRGERFKEIVSSLV